jgi:hypothetical protein
MKFVNSAIAITALAGVACLPMPTLAQGGAAPAGAPTPPAADQTAAPSNTAGTTTAGKRTLTITVPEAGDYNVRILPSKDAKDPNQLPSNFKDAKTTIEIDPVAVGKTPKVAVDNLISGNTAIMPLPAADTLELHRSDFGHVTALEARVTFDGKPVRDANVTLTGATNYKQTQTVTPANQGKALFRDVPIGTAKLTVLYGDNLTQVSDIQVSTEHPAGVLTVQAPVSNKVATVDVPGAAAAAATGAGPAAVSPTPGAGASSPVAPSGQTDTGNGFLSMLSSLIGLAVVGGGIFLLYKWFQSGGMAATLKKAGIEVSGQTPPSDAGTPWQPNAPAAPVVSDPSVCQFCGQKKDTAGNCACTLSGAALATGPSSPAIPTQPRLVGTMGVYSGTVFPLNVNGTAVTMGREATNSIPLGDDTTVSRRHAAIRVDSGTYIVSDEGSSNGVYVNGVRINGAQPLKPGDEVQIGNTRFRFEV